MRENTKQKISEYRHFSRNVSSLEITYVCCILVWVPWVIFIHKWSYIVKFPLDTVGNHWHSLKSGPETWDLGPRDVRSGTWNLEPETLRQRTLTLGTLKWDPGTWQPRPWIHETRALRTELATHWFLVSWD